MMIGDMITGEMEAATSLEDILLRSRLHRSPHGRITLLIRLARRTQIRVILIHRIQMILRIRMVRDILSFHRILMARLAQEILLRMLAQRTVAQLMLQLRPIQIQMGP